MMMAEFFSVGGKNYLEILVWPGGGTIGLVLWALSIVMVAMIVQVLLAVRRTTILPPVLQEQMKTLFENRQYRDAIELANSDQSYLATLVSSALAEAPRGYHAMERALEEASEDRTTRYLRSVEYLNLLGNVGPMIGLLGTVWGMINAFFQIVAAGGIPDPGMLANALGIKLVCTLMGLVVAIPALTVYGLIRNRIDVLCAEGLVTAQGMISAFRPGATKKEAAAAAV